MRRLVDYVLVWGLAAYISLASGCSVIRDFSQLLDKDFRARLYRLQELNQQFSEGVECYYEPTMRGRLEKLAEEQGYN